MRAKRKVGGLTIKSEWKWRQSQRIKRRAAQCGLSIAQMKAEMKAERKAMEVALAAAIEAERKFMAELARRIDPERIRLEQEWLYRAYCAGSLPFAFYEDAIAALNERIRAGEYDRTLN